MKLRALGHRVDQPSVFLLYQLFGHLERFLPPGLACAAMFALAGCDGALSTVAPAGPAARDIAGLWWLMLTGSVVIFALVAVLLAVTLLRRGERPTTDDRRQERIWIVGLGLGFTITVLAALLGYGLVIGERLTPTPGDDVVRVHAEARRWSWRFTYDDAPGRATEDVLHLPAGRPVDVSITSIDVAHSFWVPRLAGKLDAIPGHVNVLRLEATAAGTYAGVTAEFNGPGYREHVFTVVAHTADGWQAFLRGESP